MAYQRPSAYNIMTGQNFASYVQEQQTPTTSKARRTTQSMSGGRQYQTNSYALSDILQGSLGVRGPEDGLMIINKALSGQLQELHDQEYSHLSLFSTAERLRIGGGTDELGEGSGGGGTPGSVEGSLTGAEVAQIGYQIGITEDSDPPLWKIVTISYRESKWNPNATNSKTSDRGLWQINMAAHAEKLVEEGILTGSGYEAWTPQLHDPIINAKAVQQIIYGRGGDPVGNFNHAWGADPETCHWVGSDGDPLACTDPEKGKQAVAEAKALGLLGKPWTGYDVQPGAGSGGAGFVGNVDLSGANSIDEILYACGKVYNHPNFWAAKSGDYVSGLRNVMTKGGTPNVTDGSNVNPYDYVIFKRDGRCFLFPNLVNYLWIILESGFILGNYLGSIGFKYIKDKDGNKTNKISNHSYGGAIDIGAIGIASEGKTYPVSAGNRDSRRVGDKLFNLLATLPSTAIANEHGCDWDIDYGNGVDTHLDPGHIHLGFKPDRTGTLLSALTRGGRSSRTGSGSDIRTLIN